MKKMLPILIILSVSVGAFFLLRKQKTGVASSSSNIFSSALLESNLMIKSLGNIGIRNNNPLNLRPTANSRRDPWVGQNGEVGGYIRFIDPIYGFRAAARTLNTYLSKGINTISAIVSKWAPKEDGNDPVTYGNFVSKQTGIPTYQPINSSQFPIILKAMAKMETGKDYDLQTIIKGLSLINVQTPKGLS